MKFQYILLLLKIKFVIFISIKGTDPLKIDQIFQFLFFFLRKVYTFSSSFIWYDNHYRGATRSTSGRGTKVARSLRKEAQFRSDWCVFYFILFILYIFFSPFTTLQYLIFSTINCPKMPYPHLWVAGFGLRGGSAYCFRSSPEHFTFLFFSIFETFHRLQFWS